ncbi:MAG: hypothetical protein V3V02_07140 [Rhizobiaceae bacterium]
MFNTITQLLIAAGLALSLGTQVQAGQIDRHIQSKTFPQCDDIKVLGKIVERFNWAEEATWNRGFYLQDIERVRERVVQGTRRYQIPRRYCRAHARLTNGKHPTLFYLIEGGQGFAGNSFNVEFCLGGLDRWNEYDGSCRVLRY